VATTKARYGALQQRSGDQQRSVNAAYAQLQDPSHNLAVLMNWVGRQLTVRARDVAWFVCPFVCVSV